MINNHGKKKRRKEKKREVRETKNMFISYFV